jgi:DeoR/GlpR family transcriptional regulator of sugar metabolism
MMLSAERKRLILDVVGRKGRVVAAELAGRFGVSEDTVRRDLRELAAEGLLHRVYGGALAPPALPKAPVSPSHAARVEQARAEKAAIADAAARLIAGGNNGGGTTAEPLVITIDSGTTPLHVAEHLPDGARLMVVTHSLPVLRALAGRPGIELISIGGRVHPESLAATGAVTVDAYRAIRADACVLGVAGVDVTAGVTALNHDEAQVKRAMAEHASRVIAVAAADKLGTAGPFAVAPIERVTHLVTDRAASARALRPFKEAGLKVVTA